MKEGRVVGDEAHQALCRGSYVSNGDCGCKPGVAGVAMSPL
jgi:hypothetical protein